MREIHAVVFDLDGTLIDSVPDIAAALNRCLIEAGRVAMSEVGVARLVGGGARELVAKALGPDAAAWQVDRVHADFLRYYQADPVARTRLYPGVLGLLDGLATRGIALALCTNKPAPLTHAVLRAFDMTDYFRIVWAGEANKPLKPDAACLRSVCAGLAISPAQAVMVGDSRADVLAARAAGCWSLLVTHGYETSDPADLGAERIVPDVIAVMPELEAMGLVRPVTTAC